MDRPTSYIPQLLLPSLYVWLGFCLLLCHCGGNRHNDTSQQLPETDLAITEPGEAVPVDLTVTELQDALRSHIQAGVGGGQVEAAGVGVVTKGGLFFYAGQGIKKDEPFPIYSLTKTFAAVTTMGLVAANRLSLHASPAKFVPIPATSRLQKATVVDLLNHTSGMSYGGSIHQVTGARGNHFYFTEPVYEPDTTFVYYNDNYALVGAILEAVTAKPLAQLLGERILKPLAMSQTTMASHGDGSTGLYSTVSDLARFVCALADGGKCGSVAIIKPQLLERMKTIKTHISYDKLIGGLGLYRGQGPAGVFFYNHGLYADKTSSFRLYSGYGVIQFSRTAYFRDPGYVAWRERALELGAALARSAQPALKD